MWGGHPKSEWLRVGFLPTNTQQVWPGQLGGDGVGQGQCNVLWVANLGNKWWISEYRLIAFAFAVLLKIQPPSSNPNIPQQPRISRPPIFGKQLIIRGNKNTAHFLSALGRCLGPDVRSYQGPWPGTRGRDQPNFPAERSVARGTLLLARQQPNLPLQQ